MMSVQNATARGFAELQVYGAIPEPSAAILSLAGVALLLRRRR